MALDFAVSSTKYLSFFLKSLWACMRSVTLGVLCGVQDLEHAHTCFQRTFLALYYEENILITFSLCRAVSGVSIENFSCFPNEAEVTVRFDSLGLCVFFLMA